MNMAPVVKVLAGSWIQPFMIDTSTTPDRDSAPGRTPQESARLSICPTMLPLLLMLFAELSTLPSGGSIA
jgi:hypothetical protein